MVWIIRRRIALAKRFGSGHLRILRIHSIRFQLAAFLIPFGVRLVPEAFSHSYPIGFDTVAYYIPIMQARLALSGGIANYLGGTILPYLLLTYAYLRVGNAILVMKIVPAILLGFFGWSAFVLGHRVLKWNYRWSFVLALLCPLSRRFTLR